MINKDLIIQLQEELFKKEQELNVALIAINKNQEKMIGNQNEIINALTIRLAELEGNQGATGIAIGETLATPPAPSSSQKPLHTISAQQ